MKTNIFLIVVYLMFIEYCFAQNNIVIENTTINNTATYYGANNTVTSTSSESKPVSVLTGDKKVEFVAGSRVSLKPGFRATAQSTGNFRAYISPGFTIPSNPNPNQPNEFKIGVFGFKYIQDGAQPWCVSAPAGTGGTTMINGQTAYSSQLNVLKQDGFNVVQKYGWPEGYLGDNSVYLPMIIANQPDFKPGDKVIVSRDSLKIHLHEKYNVKPADSIQFAWMFEIINKR